MQPTAQLNPFAWVFRSASCYPQFSLVYFIFRILYPQFCILYFVFCILREKKLQSHHKWISSDWITSGVLSWILIRRVNCPKFSRFTLSSLPRFSSFFPLYSCVWRMFRLPIGPSAYSRPASNSNWTNHQRSTVTVVLLHSHKRMASHQEESEEWREEEIFSSQPLSTFHFRPDHARHKSLQLPSGINVQFNYPIQTGDQSLWSAAGSEWQEQRRKNSFPPRNQSVATWATCTWVKITDFTWVNAACAFKTSIDIVPA